MSYAIVKFGYILISFCNILLNLSLKSGINILSYIYIYLFRFSFLVSNRNPFIV